MQDVNKTFITTLSSGSKAAYFYCLETLNRRVFHSVEGKWNQKIFGNKIQLPIFATRFEKEDTVKKEKGDYGEQDGHRS